ncbi:MAG: glycosyltransferase family 4 protein [Muribaculaceae bacterium]|nr:glycosyltransferase family 4 protein [Muribaculaceae bacterium]
MRIIHLVRATTWGGGEQYAKDLCDYSAEAGHRVTVFTRGIPQVDNRFTCPGIQREELPLGGVFDFVSPRKLAKWINGVTDREVFVHVHTFKDAEIVARAKRIVGKRKKIVLVCTRHLVKRGKKSFRWKRIYSALDRLIFVSELAKSEFLSSNPPIESSKLTVIHNSVRVPKHEPVETVEEQKEIRLLYTGRVSEEKGIDVLIKSLAIIKNTRLKLIIAGTGPESLTDSLKKLASELGVSDRIEWTGFLEDVYSEIRSADICVAPSRWREPFGLTIIEFMSQGKPVITTSNGDKKEIITDGEDGLLEEPDTSEALAEAIARLVSDESLRMRLGDQAAKTFNSRFTYPVFFQKIITAYEQAAGSKGPGRE